MPREALPPQRPLAAGTGEVDQPGEQGRPLLRESDERFRTLVENVPGAVYRCGCDRHWTMGFVSDAIEGLTGYPVSDFLANAVRTYASVIHPDDRERVALAVEEAARENRPFELEYKIVHADGSPRWVLERGRAALDAAGTPQWLDGVIFDVSDRRRAKEQLAQAEERYRRLVEEIPLVTYVDALDDSATTLYISPQVEAILGYPVEDWLSDPDLWAKLLHPDDRERALAENAYHNETGRAFRLEYRLIARDGREVWFLDEAVVEQGPDGRPLWSRGYMLDITERKALEQQLAHQALHDPLTGLANRVLFRDRIEHALLRQRRGGGSLAVLLLDLDDFKTVNDSLGHPAGDELLAQAGARIRSCLRGGDTAARVSGDEFGVLLEGRPQADAEDVAERMTAELAEPFSVAGREVFVGASVGIALGGSPGEGSEELLRNADVAMYRAKARGKARRVVYEPAMHGEALRRLELTSELQRALQHAELVLHYQPIVALESGAILGVEALVRWAHPERGLVTPPAFIPLAEQNGLIVQIGRWVINEACATLGRWSASGIAPSFLSVNISPRELREPDLVTAVEAALGAHGVEPRRLVLEITETALMGELDRVTESLRALGEVGVRIAIDDFGTGYSSLSYLKQLPVDILKIAKPFIDGLGGGPDDERLAKAILSIGRSLRLQTIAEGVELEEQLARLRSLRCELAQGFYFGRPADVAGIETLLREAALRAA